jgi:membrane fusion protein, heavy metal efflux system
MLISRLVIGNISIFNIKTLSTLSTPSTFSTLKHSKKMKKYIIISSLFIAACGNNKSKETTSQEVSPKVEEKITLTEAQAKNTNISVGAMTTQDMATLLKLNGKIDVPPQNLVSVSVPLGGYLKNTKLLPGMHIRKGEVIATMEDQQYIQLQQDFLLTKSKLYFAEQEYQRQKTLNQTQASSDKVTQQAEAEVKNNKILLSALTEKLKLIGLNPSQLDENNLSKSIAIHAPIAGFVSRVNVNIGKYCNPSDILFELVNPEDIHLNLKVYEKDINQLGIGQRLVAYSNAKPDKKYPCEIILISKDVAQDGSTEVHCHFDRYDKTLLPGMFMNADVTLQQQAAYVLPEDAIVHFEGKNYIFVQEAPLTYSMQEVELGAKEKNIIQVVNYQQFMNKKIVIKGAYTLLMKGKNVEEE